MTTWYSHPFNQFTLHHRASLYDYYTQALGRTTSPSTVTITSLNLLIYSLDQLPFIYIFFSYSPGYKMILRKFITSDRLPYFVSNLKVSPSGKRKVIAVGSLDISEYIMGEPTSHEITVTLKSVKKAVLSGSLEFTLSSVMLEDGVPR